MDYGVYSLHSACLRTISAHCQIQSTPRFCTNFVAKIRISEHKTKNFIFFFVERESFRRIYTAKLQKNYEL